MSSPRFLILLSLAFFSYHAADCQSTFWRSTSGPPGGDVRVVLSMGKGRFLAGTYGGGASLSDDSGSTWRIASTGMGNLFVICGSKGRAGDAYLGLQYGGVYRTTDYGETWTGVLEGSVHCVMATPNGDVFAGLSRYLNRSTDDGVTWTQVVDGSNYGDFVSLATSADRKIYACCGSVLFTSIDGGSTWTGRPAFNMRSIATLSPTTLFACSDYGVFRSTDDGSSWTTCNGGISMGDVWSIRMNPSGILFVGNSIGQIFRSTDQGTTWTQSQVASYRAYVWSISAIDGSSIVAGVGEDAIRRSTDGGLTWIDSFKGIFNVNVLALTTDADGNIFAGTGGLGVFRSSNGGDSWIATALDDITVFAITSTPNNTLLAGGYSGPHPERWGIYRSTDKGSNWDFIPFGVPRSFAADEEGNLYVGMDANGLFISTDDGVSWAYRGLKNSWINAIVSDRSGSIYASYLNVGVLRSSNKGQSWTVASAGLGSTDVRALLIDRHGQLYAGTVPGNVYRSTDRGVSWNLLPTGINSYYVEALSQDASGWLYAGTQDISLNGGEGVLRSTDDGLSWEHINGGLLSSLVESFTTDADGFMYAGTGSSGVYKSLIAAADVYDAETGHPERLNLSQNYPNPFNQSTTIKYELSHASRVSLKIYNTLGQEVATLVNETRPAGVFTVQFDAGRLASGVYFYRIVAGPFTEMKRLLLIR